MFAKCQNKIQLKFLKPLYIILIVLKWAVNLEMNRTYKIWTVLQMNKINCMKYKKMTMYKVLFDEKYERDLNEGYEMYCLIK